MEHPEYYDCMNEGAEHRWTFQGHADDGTEFYRCKYCGLECEV